MLNLNALGISDKVEVDKGVFLHNNKYNLTIYKIYNYNKNGQEYFFLF